MCYKLLQKVLLLLWICLSNTIVHAQKNVTRLSADGPGDTYELISGVLAPGGNPIEAPGFKKDGCNNDAKFGEHISEVYDKELGKNVFQFNIHKKKDNDRCKKFDRQRNEIKAYKKSPDKLKGVKGETVIYNWKFKLDKDFQVSKNFTHIFQIKAKGEGKDDDDSNPIVTISPYKSSASSAKAKMRIVYSEGDYPAKGKEYKTVKEVALAPFLGKWMEVTCEIYINESSATITENEKPGSVHLSIKEVATGAQLLVYKNTDLDMLRTGTNIFLRPKWGIYRSLKSEEQLRDEVLYFADFTITEK